MKIIKPEDCTRVLGESQGYDPLPLRDELITLSLSDGSEIPNVPRMVTHWVASPSDIAMLMSGGCLQIAILGQEWPPISVEVIDDKTLPEQG